MSTTALDRPVFLFDADCGVCQDGTDLIRARIAPPVDIVGHQTVDHDALGVSDAELEEGPVFVSPEGWHVVGPLAMAQMFRLARRPYRGIGTIMLLPGVRHVLKALGPTMYRNRDRLPGASGSCSVPARGDGGRVG
jgi:hypothetical protein